MPQSQLAPAPASYAWIFDLLFAKQPAVTWAAAGGLPAEFARVEQFAVLAATPGRSFVVSLAARPGTASALTSYNALRPARTRLARSALGAALRAGLAQPLLRSKVDVGVAVGAGGRGGDLLLTGYLSKFFRRGPVVIAFGAGSGPYRKPVLQVFDTSGTPLGYVKVGWNNWTRDAVRREAAALRACAGRASGFGVPGLLGQLSWHGLDLLVTAPLPAGVRRLAEGADGPDLAMLREISELDAQHRAALAVSPWWQDLRARIAAGVTDQAARAQLRLVTDRIEERHGRATLRFGWWHGDLVPWNLARDAGRLYAWDWESSAPQAPVGFDALHYHFQQGFVARGLPLAAAAARAAAGARQALAELGVAPADHELLAQLHLAELFVRHEEARSSTADRDARFYPDVAGVLARSLGVQLAAAGGERSAGRAA